MNRPKFLRYYGAVNEGGITQPFGVVQLRVEQIGPHLWGGALYKGCWPVPNLDGSDGLAHVWDRFTALTEEAAKHAAWATATNLFGPARGDADEDWRCCTDASEESWTAGMQAIAFPGKYPGHEGMDRFPDF
jgi:hypothetical protein